MKPRMPQHACVTLLLTAAIFGVFVCHAAEPGRTAWWPEFHGPNRDNISPDTGLLQQWPDGGPRLIWQYSDCGGGYATVSIADGMIFTSGDFDEVEMVIALDMDGNLLWKSPNGASWNGPYPGSRTNPTYRDGVVYQMNPSGRLVALDARTGRRIWAVDLRSEFGAQFGTWAMSENVAVEGDLVLCVPGGDRGLVVALDKATGKTVWTNTELDEIAAYCSPVIVTHQGVRQLITLTQKSVIGVDVQTGKLLWSHPHVTPNDQNVTMPVFHDGYVFASSGHSGGGSLIKIDADLRGAKEIWSNEEFDNCHGGVILIDGRLYGSGCRTKGRQFHCVDFLTGRSIQVDTDLEKLSLTFADGMLYGLSNKGEMLLMAASPDGFCVISQFLVPEENKDQYFAHPVVCGGRLYVRHGNDLYCYDVRAE